MYAGSSTPFEDAYFWDVTAISYVLIPAGLMMGTVLLAMRRWTLPPGSLTMIFTVNAALMFMLGVSYSGGQWMVLPAALGVGIWWRIHMWLGAPFLAGMVGPGLSFLLSPPAQPTR